MTLLALHDVAKHFAVGSWRHRRTLRAVDGIDLAVMAGEAVGLVGESGCGKSTVARLALRLIEPTRGRIDFEGADITSLREREMRPLRRNLQLVAQNPHAALDPRRTVFASVAEPLAVLEGLSGKTLRERVTRLIVDVALTEAFLWRYPHELSGGQKQRVCIARALALEPRLVILDEPTSALDVSVQAQILDLLARLRSERRLAFLFISHNLAVVRQMCDRVAIMYLGRIVEEGPAASVFTAPRHPYTRALIESVLPPRAGSVPRRSLAGDPPSPTALPDGCRFASRCPSVMPRCHDIEPALSPREEGGRVACHLA